MDGFAFARAVHVVAVVVWIGGVSLVTTTLLPAIRRGALGGDWLAAFQAIERRFVWQARAAILLVGASGFYLVAAADLWSRFRDAGYWWMDAMVGVWAIFALGLFVAEPLVIDRHFHDWARRRPGAAFAALAAVHWLLLALSLVTVFGAVAGSHGWPVF